MTIVYKHMSTKHLHRFLTGAGIRVGTLHGFRDEERFEKGIGDRLEGLFERRLNGEFDDVHDNERVRTLLAEAKLISMGPGAKLSKLIFDNGATLASYPDCFVFCASKSTDVNISLENSEPTSIVRINDAEAFCYTVLHALHDAGLASGSGLFGEVTYAEMSVDFFTGETKEPSPFVKQIDFEFQQEFRFVFAPRDNPISAVVLKDMQWPEGLFDVCYPVLPTQSRT